MSKKVSILCKKMINNKKAENMKNAPHSAVLCYALEMCMGMGIFSFPWEFHGNGITHMPNMGMGRVHVTVGMGMATFSCVPKFP